MSEIDTLLPVANDCFAAPQKTRARRGAGFLVRIESVVQLDLRRLTKPTPARPRPRSESVAGSGTEGVASKPLT